MLKYNQIRWESKNAESTRPLTFNELSPVGIRFPRVETKRVDAWDSKHWCVGCAAASLVLWCCGAWCPRICPLPDAVCRCDARPMHRILALLICRAHVLAAWLLCFPPRRWPTECAAAIVQRAQNPTHPSC
jgi:hypothetical protein